MDIKEKAKKFAIKAHMGQIRKSDPDKPLIIHPISVGMMLEEYGYDDQVVAAGYLHDVVEDTKYTVQDIEKEFGEDIANLVMTASEPDKSLSWEERKKDSIERAKTLPLRNKLVICADKINNMECLVIQFQKEGKRDFSRFNRGEEQQKWYQTNIYKSLTFGEDKDLPIFKRLKKALDNLFDYKDDLYLRDTIFDDNKEYYEQLKRLHAQKLELVELKKLAKIKKPYVIEFSGTLRTGKTTTINNLYDFFKKAGFNISIIEEFTTSKEFKEKYKPKFKNNIEKYLIIIEKYASLLEEELKNDNDIIIVDRSLNDRQIWNYTSYINGKMPKKIYLKTRNKYKKKSKEMIDCLVITFCDPLISLKRDYNSSLVLEKRSFLNNDNIEEYNNSLESLKDLFKESVDKLLIIDTGFINIQDVSVDVASQIMIEMRKKYIESFKEEYNLK